MSRLFALALVVLVAVIGVNTARFGSRQPAVAAVAPATVSPDIAAQLGGAVRFRTISHQDPAQFDGEAFRGLRRYLEQTFPRVHRTLGREVVAGYSLLYTWKGSAAGAPPIVLLSHLDVVPVEAATENAWAQPPFAGTTADGFVWGRGALDDKTGVIGLLAAAESLLAEGFTPRCTVYFAFGHDEEVGGREGAMTIARDLAARGVRAALVLDEGLAVTEGIVPDVVHPVALVGIAEKGYLSLELAVESEGGHSSRPPRETAVGILASAIDSLQRHPLPPALDGATRRLFEFIGPEMSLVRRVAFANMWLFGPAIRRRLATAPETDALMRTTTAPTMLSASVKENVLPARAAAVVNFRIRPGDTSDGVIAHVRDAVDDARVTIAPYGPTRSEASPETSVDGPAFALMARTIRETFPDSIVAPALVLGATDSRHYAGVSDAVFRFLPVHMHLEDAHRVHGTNERVAVADLTAAVRFYRRLMENAGGR